MSMNMPEPVAAYFAADKLDGAAVARCFTKDAVVKDEAHMYAGTACIERWKTEASAKYHYTCEPFRSEQKDGVIEVTCHLTGETSRVAPSIGQHRSGRSAATSRLQDPSVSFDLKLTLTQRSSAQLRGTNYSAAMPFSANSFFALSFLARCVRPMPRSTLGALVNWMLS